MSGRYEGEPLTLPLVGLPAARPSGPLLAPVPTGPAFNVFVVLTVPSRIRLSLRSAELEIRWPASAGSDVLQSSDSPGAETSSTWVTNRPTLSGDDYIVRKVLTNGQKFYRLRSK